MDDADKILIDTLISLGLEISSNEISFDDFSPDILISTTSFCLEIIYENKNEPQTFPKSYPANMAARYKIGQALSEAIKSLGYKETLGYQSFLYPNVRDTRKIVSFLVEKLPKDVISTLEEGGTESTLIKNKITDIFNENWRSPWLPYYCKTVTYNNYTSPKYLLINSHDDRIKLPHLSKWFDSFPSIQSQTINIGDLLSSIRNYEKKTKIVEEIDKSRIVRQLTELDKLQQSVIQDSIVKIPPKIIKRKKTIKKEEENEKSSEIKVITEDIIQILEDKLNEIQLVFEKYSKHHDDAIKRLESLHENYKLMKIKKEKLKEEIEIQSKNSIIKEKTGIVLMHGVESIDKLKSAIDKREQQLESIESQWKIHKNELLEKVQSIQEQQLEKHSKTKEIENNLKSIRDNMENCRRDYQEKDVQIKILDEKVKQIIKSSPTQVKQNRNEFTKRILELTENKKKQNFEIKRILKDIFILQKEINSLRGKLERSFEETNDCIFSNAKKDEISKKMYKVVQTIHENCQSLVNVIEEKGKLLREIRDLEMIVENENRESLEKNLEQIATDYEEAKRNCEVLKRKIQQYSEAFEN